VLIWIHHDEVQEGGKFEISYGGGNYRTSAPMRILPKNGNYRTSAPKVLNADGVGQRLLFCNFRVSKIQKPEYQPRLWYINFEAMILPLPCILAIGYHIDQFANNFSVFIFLQTSLDKERSIAILIRRSQIRSLSIKIWSSNLKAIKVDTLPAANNQYC
jgi:hypothetical protein